MKVSELLYYLEKVNKNKKIYVHIVNKKGKRKLVEAHLYLLKNKLVFDAS